MILLIILLLSSLGFAWRASLRLKSANNILRKHKLKKWHDYSLLFAGFILILIAGKVEMLTKL